MNQIINTIKTSLITHMPGMLTGIGIASFGSAVVLAVTATPKAIQLMEEKKQETKKDELNAKEILQTTWKCYIPPAVMFGIGTGCTVAGLKVSERRGAAWATAYSLSESAFRDYQDKVTEKLGEKKEKQIRDEIAQDKINEKPINKADIIQTGRGLTLCKDLATERVFMVDIDDILHAEEYAKEQLGKDGPGCLDWNELYFQFHVGPIGMGEDNGWNRQRPLRRIITSSCLAENGTPLLAIDYDPRPYPEFWKYDDGTLM